MEIINPTLKNILHLLEEKRGFDFSGYRSSMLERRIQKRMYSTSCKNLSDYLEYLNYNPDESDHLINVFTINVSRFFRNSLTWEYIRKILLPDLYYEKIKANDNSLRIWSAGCSYGEEPYSLAIIINELTSMEEDSLNLNIFATDLDKKAIKLASEGIYGFDSVKRVKYGIYKKYFTRDAENYVLDQEIKKKVQFSFFDLLDKKHMVPPESIFGGFDIVLCRNVLIYFDLGHQKIIFNKLYKSLNPNGYLILGESEVPGDEFKNKLQRDNSCCKIYRKVGH
ncbi:MAG: protein-glutamate O-methyltransferase CheR [Bacteroidales bacterium]|nr:protein-glutamate O-methyltransferase CheR [Bacteroidales bacterium]